MSQYIAFSGGIDSTALALCIEDATPIFTDTGDEFPEIYAHIRKFERVTGREVVKVKSHEGTLLEYTARQKFFPNFHARFCTRIFKIEALEAFLPAGSVVYVGLRADEPDRAGAISTHYHVEFPFRAMGYTRSDCIRKCLEYDLLPRYPAYMLRGGCKSCYFKSRAELVAMYYQAPRIFDELKQRELAVQDRRDGFFYMFPNIGKSLAQFADELEQAPMMFEPDVVFKNPEYQHGKYCGLFCHK